MRRAILFIFIPVAMIVLFVIGAMLNYTIGQNDSSPDTKILYTTNLTSGGNGSGINASIHNTQPPSTLDVNEKIKSIENMPTKCLGSALCPDYDYYPSSLWQA